jgi:hypothetical protein
MNEEQRLPDLTRHTEDVYADFARAIGVDVRMVWRVHHLIRLLGVEDGSKRDPEAGPE